MNEHKRNVGALDRVLTGIVGAGVIALGVWQATRQPWRLAIALLGPPLLVRAGLGRCAVYRALGIDTTGRERERAEQAA